MAPDNKSKKKRKPKKKATATPINDAEGPVENGKDDDVAAVEAADAQSGESDTDAQIEDAPLSDTKHSPVAEVTNGVGDVQLENDVTTRFDALVEERDALRNEVTQLRKSLEDLQANHTSQLTDVQTQLEESQAEKENAEEQYQNLLGKVNTIRSQLAERMKSDAEDLAQARVQIEELEEQKAGLQEDCTAKAAEMDTLRTSVQEQSKELSSLRNRSTLSQQNWVKEKEELLESEAYMREEYENAKQAMHDWEVLAMEERTIRKDLSDRVKDLEEQLENVKDGYQRAKEERDTNSSAVEGLQKALQEIQTVRKTELKEVVESSQAEVATLRDSISTLQTELDTARTDLASTKGELERTLPFEKEVKEKNLLIGKLRHEAVTLNDHLTKALRFLKKGKPEDNVDR
jgi:chromosome segregation ATPase